MTAGRPSWTICSSVPQIDFPQRDRDLHLARQVGVVELVGVADSLMRRELDILAAEGMALLRAEVGERHAIAAADAGVDLVDFAGEAVRRKPLGHGVGIEKCAIDAIGRGAQHAV